MADDASDTTHDRFGTCRNGSLNADGEFPLAIADLWCGLHPDFFGEGQYDVIFYHLYRIHEAIDRLAEVIEGRTAKC